MRRDRCWLLFLLFAMEIAFGQDKPRVFLQSASHGNTWAARRDQSMEMAKDFQAKCPGTTITIAQDKADYTVILNHIEVGLFARDNQMEVANREGSILSVSEKGAIKRGVSDACRLILADWEKKKGPEPPSPALAPAPGPTASGPDYSARARQNFADEAGRRLRAEGAGFAEVVNTTLVIHCVYADKDGYETLIGDQKFMNELRRRGFSQLVYTNDHQRTFTWGGEPHAEAKEPRSF
jgi:hypothetical protein